jgi:hypothetical protein
MRGSEALLEWCSPCNSALAAIALAPDHAALSMMSAVPLS